MRKSLLTVIVVGAVASGAAPSLTAESTQQRVEHYASMPNGMSGAYLNNPPSETKLPTCTAGSAKDVAIAHHRCG